MRRRSRRSTPACRRPRRLRRARRNPALKRKRDLEKQIQDQQLAIDKKLFARYWGQAVFGFSGQTPTSDGKHVCVFFTTGVAACYDLDGNRKWITRGSGGGSEHGNFASPLLCGNRLVVWANEMRAYDVDSGKLAWTNAAKAFNTYGSLFRVESGGELVAGFQWGFFTRVRDGQPIWDKGAFGDSVATPIVEGDTIFAHGGYPKYNDKTTGLKAFKIPASTDSGKLTVAYEFKEQWADDELPVDKQKNPSTAASWPRRFMSMDSSTSSRRAAASSSTTRRPAPWCIAKCSRSSRARSIGIGRAAPPARRSRGNTFT